MTTKDYKALSRLIMYDKIKRFYEEDHQSRGASAPWSRHGRWVPFGETGTDDNGLEAKDIEHAAMVLERQDAVWPSVVATNGKLVGFDIYDTADFLLREYFEHLRLALFLRLFHYFALAFYEVGRGISVGQMKQQIF